MYQDSNSLLVVSPTNLRRNKSSFKKKSNNNTIIIGLNKRAIELYEQTKNYPALGYEVVGFVSLKRFEKAPSNKIPYLGNFNSISKYIKLFNIKNILIAIAPDQHSSLEEIIDICTKFNLSYQIVSDVYNVVYGNVIKDIYHDLYQYKEFSLRRAFDLFGSFFLLFFLLPIFAVIGLAIKVESPGSIFYSHQRTGKNGKLFRIYKFRTMVQNADNKSDMDVVYKNDVQITSVGSFLRRTRIDELPQLLNIFKGDMSFIGPNPERPFFVESFKQQIPFYVNRLKFKPGVTGLAQVKWGFEETIADVKEKLKYDLYYINNRTVWLDLQIILLTLESVLLNKR